MTMGGCPLSIFCSHGTPPYVKPGTGGHAGAGGDGFRNVKRFRGGLVFKAHILMWHSTLGLRVIKKKNKVQPSRARPRFMVHVPRIYALDVCMICEECLGRLSMGSMGVMARVWQVCRHGVQ